MHTHYLGMNFHKMKIFSKLKNHMNKQHHWIKDNIMLGGVKVICIIKLINMMMLLDALHKL